MRTLLLTLTTCLLVLPVQAKYSGGSGTAQDPYQIATAADLIALGETPNDYDKHFILTADIDLDPSLPGRKVFNQAVIAPVRIISASRGGYPPYPSGPSFAGVFHGKDHTISNLTVAGEHYVGLFGRLASGADVKALGVVRVNITCSGDNIGGLVGYNGGAVTECYSAGEVRGGHHVGGLVGQNLGAITNCYAVGSVAGHSRVGGLAGTNGSEWQEPLTGKMIALPGEISYCYSASVVTATASVGGLLGENIHGMLIGCFWDIERSAQATSVGGTGKTTAEMRAAKTFLDAGWDFVGETANGTEDIWRIDEGNDYPRLSWEPRKYSGGTGEPNDPYQIATAADLIALGETPEDYDRHFILTADIDLDPQLPGRKVFQKAIIAPTDAITMGFQGTAFAGKFDGDGHVIRNAYIRGTSYLGVFGYLLSTALVCNLGVESATVSGTGYSVGGLVGHNDHGRITASHASGSVSGMGEDVGGLVGSNDQGSIIASWSTGSVYGSRLDVGGLVGWNYHGSIAASYSSASVNGAGRVGGLVGYNDNGNIATSYSTGKVRETEYSGGLVGYNILGVVSGCFWDIQTSERDKSSGGTGLATAQMQMAKTFLDAGWDFVGETANGTCDYWQMPPEGYPLLRYRGDNLPLMPEGLGTTEQPYLIRDAQDLGTVWFEPLAHYRLAASVDLSGITWSMAVIPWFGGSFDGNGYVISNLHIQGGSYLGLFGELDAYASICNLGAEAVDVNGVGINVGGVAGYSDGTIVASYSSGSVNGERHVGGLVGENYRGRIAASYSCCSVDAKMWYAGGLVGYNDSGNIATSYSTGKVRGTDYSGGLIGYNFGVVTGCFWDTQTSERDRSSGGTGLATAQMQMAKTFLDAGWDFVGETANGTCDYWQMRPEGYPVLRYRGDNLPLMPEGLGTTQQPYLIRDAQDLGTVWFEPLAHYRLAASVDLSGITWSMAVIPWFGGSFDGNGYVISNLHIQGGSYLGLFGELCSHTRVSNLGLEAVDVNGIGDDIGALVGYNRGRIAASYGSGFVAGNFRVGGLAGYNEGGNIATGYSRSSVKGSGWDVGGLVGYNRGTIAMSYSAGAVSARSLVGGLVGFGYLGSVYVSGSFWDTETSGQATSAGGTGKTTAEMQTAKTFLDAGWDFVGETANGTEDIWWILEGKDYPRLWWEAAKK